MQQRLISFKLHNSHFTHFITLLHKEIKGKQALRDDIEILPIFLHNSTGCVTAAKGYVQKHA